MNVYPSWAVLGACGLLLVAVAGGATRTLGWRRAATWRRAAMLALLAVIGLQVQGVTAEGIPPAGTDIVLVIDRTTSMGAQDFDGDRPRIEGVAHDVTELVATQPGARYSVVVVDNEAQLALPWTTDSRAVRTLAETLGWRESALGNGSDVTAGFELAESLLADAASSRPEAYRYLVYLGDGEQTGEEPVRDLGLLRDLLTDALVLGYGTQEGGVMASSPRDPTLVTLGGEVAVSRLDPVALEAIADALAGSFLHRTRPDAIEFWPAQASAPATASRDTAPPTVSWLAALALAPLVAWELWDATLTHLRARKELTR